MDRRTRGFTLVEALVVTALAVVVLGIALDALIETNRAVDAVSEKLVALREAESIAQQVEKQLRARIPGNLVAGKHDAERFVSNEIRLVSAAVEQPKHSAPAASNDPFGDIANRPYEVTPTLVRIANDRERKRVVLESELPDGKSRKIILGDFSDAYQAEIIFAYADRIENEVPMWQDQATSPPKLVKVLVRVWPRKAGMATFDQARAARWPRVAQLEHWVAWP